MGLLLLRRRTLTSSSTTTTSSSSSSAGLAASKQEAWRAFRELQQAERASTRHYNTMLRVCTAEQGMSLLTELRAARLVPDADTYAPLMEAHLAEGKRDEAGRLLRIATNEGLRPTLRMVQMVPSRTGAAPDELLAKVFEALVAADAARPLGAATAQHARAWALFRETQAAGLVTRRIYSTMARAAASSDDMDALVLQMRKDGLRPSVKMFNAVIRHHVAEGNLPAARGVLERIRAEGLRPNARSREMLTPSAAKIIRAKHVTSVLRARVASGDTEGAWEMFDACRKEGDVNAHHYAAMLTACSKRGDSRGSRRGGADLDAIADTGSGRDVATLAADMRARGIDPTPPTLAALIRAHLGASPVDIDAAHGVLGELGEMCRKLNMERIEEEREKQVVAAGGDAAAADKPFPFPKRNQAQNRAQQLLKKMRKEVKAAEAEENVRARREELAASDGGAA